MRMFWRKPTAQPLSANVNDILVKDRGLSIGDGAALRMIERHGTYSGRSVTYFRVFNPAAVQSAGIMAPRSADVDPLTTLYTGHTERDGTVVLNGDAAWVRAQEPLPR